MGLGFGFRIIIMHILMMLERSELFPRSAYEGTITSKDYVHIFPVMLKKLSYFRPVGSGGGWGGFSLPNILAELGLHHNANINLFPSIIQTRAIIPCSVVDRVNKWKYQLYLQGKV